MISGGNSGCHKWDRGGERASGIQWVGDRDASRHPTEHCTSPFLPKQQRTIWLKISILPKSRNPDLMEIVLPDRTGVITASVGLGRVLNDNKAI